MAGWKDVFVGSVALLAGLQFATAATAQETEDRLLKASEGLQMPGSEADSAWSLVSYPGEAELPSVERFSWLTGCDHPEGGASRQDFDAPLDRLGDVQPWMDEGQRGAPAVSPGSRGSSTAATKGSPSTAARPAPPRYSSTSWGWTKTASPAS